MWLKVIMVVLIIAMLLSLSGALVALFKNEAGSNKMAKLLTLRVSLAVMIVLVLVYGYLTGELTQGAPWSGQY